jgi:hypothetical protein
LSECQEEVSVRVWNAIKKNLSRTHAADGEAGSAANTLAGFQGACAVNGRLPTEQEIWDAGVRSGMRRAEAAQQQADPEPYAASEYDIGQWWLKELDGLFVASIGSAITADMKRAAKVAINAFKAVKQQVEPGTDEPIACFSDAKLNEHAMRASGYSSEGRREAFEAYLMDLYPNANEDVSEQRVGDEYVHQSTTGKWHAWNAACEWQARAAQQQAEPGADELPKVVNTLGGFRGGFIGVHGRAPTEQEIWNGGVRSGLDRAAQCGQRAGVAEEFMRICEDEAVRGGLISLPQKLDFMRARGLPDLEAVHDWMIETRRKFTTEVKRLCVAAPTQQEGE